MTFRVEIMVFYAENQWKKRRFDIINMLDKSVSYVLPKDWKFPVLSCQSTHNRISGLKAETTGGNGL